MISTVDQLTETLKSQMKEAGGYLTDEDYESAAGDATDETGWEFPIPTGKRQLWFKSRVKRHLLFYLLTGSAVKFQAKSFSLQQRFDHYKAMIEQMDRDFAAFKTEYAEEFGEFLVAGQFGTVIGTGLVHDRYGREFTTSPGVNP